MSSLKDRIIVVMGAGGGFGRAIVSQLAAQGATLALGDLNAEPLQEVSCQALASGAAKVITGAVDVTSEESVAAFFGSIKEAFGRADTLLYLPGLSIASPVTEMPVESYDKIIDVNLKGLFLSAKHYVPLTDPAKDPMLLFISSQAATRPNPNAPVYCAAKSAVSIFGQGLALQVMKQNVRVTAIKPGPVNTDGFWGNRPVPREKFMQVGDIARVVDFVLTMPSHIVMHEVSFESFEFFRK